MIQIPGLAGIDWLATARAENSALSNLQPKGSSKLLVLVAVLRRL
jgi:hypothetical protein